MQKIVESLDRTPIVEVACSKVGINRATFYRWMQEDPVFKKDAEEALERGREKTNDVAESQLITSLKNGNMNAVKFWLSNNNTRYKRKVEFIRQELAPVPEEVLDQFMRLMYGKRYEDFKGGDDQV